MLNEIKTQLRAVEYKIQDLEMRRLYDISDISMQLELINLLKLQQELQYQELLALRDENDFEVLMMCLPLYG